MASPPLGRCFQPCAYVKRFPLVAEFAKIQLFAPRLNFCKFSYIASPKNHAADRAWATIGIARRNSCTSCFSATRRLSAPFTLGSPPGRSLLRTEYPVLSTRYSVSVPHSDAEFRKYIGGAVKRQRALSSEHCHMRTLYQKWPEFLAKIS